MKKKLNSKIIKFVIILIVVSGCVALYYFYKHQNAPLTTEQEADNLVSELGKFIMLPDERPSVALVTDKSQLSNQAFFNNAENGDKVLIFLKAKKAIIYRPSNKKIVEIGPIVEK